MSRAHYYNSQHWQSRPYGSQTPNPTPTSPPSLFTYIFISGLVLFILLLIGRQLFNWYIKHNAILQQLSHMKHESQKTNQLLGDIRKEIRECRSLSFYAGREKEDEMRNMRGSNQGMRRSGRNGCMKEE